MGSRSTLHLRYLFGRLSNTLHLLYKFLTSLNNWLAVSFPKQLIPHAHHAEKWATSRGLIDTILHLFWEDYQFFIFLHQYEVEMLTDPTQSDTKMGRINTKACPSPLRRAPPLWLSINWKIHQVITVKRTISQTFQGLREHGSVIII